MVNEFVDAAGFIHSTSLKKLLLIAHAEGERSGSCNIHQFLERFILVPETTKLCYRVTEGTTRTVTTVREFQEMGEEYVKRNRDPSQKRWIEKFSPDFTVNDYHPMSKICNLFERYFNERPLHNETASFCAVINAGNIVQHLASLIGTDSMFSCGLQMPQNNHPQSHLLGNTTLLVLDCVASMVLILRVVEDVEDIELQTRRCNDELKAFIEMHFNLLHSNNVLVIGTIAAPDISRCEIKKEVMVCEDCLPLYLTKDELTEFEGFNSWYQGLSERLSTLSDPIQQNNIDVQRNNSFVKIAGQTMAVLALTNTHLPIVTGSVHDQITSIVLNKEQLNIIQSKEKKKIVIGPFGSGKTLVAKEIAKRLLTASTTRPTVVFYVCCDPFSLLEVEMNQYVESLVKDYSTECTHSVQIKVQNIQEIALQASTVVIDLPRIIEYLCNSVESAVSKVHFVFDEVCGESITEIIAWKLRVLFSQHPLLRMSEVAFFIRSIKKCREFKSKSNLPVLYSGNRLGQTSMHVMILNKTMRVSSSISKVMESTQNEIESTSSVFIHSSAVKNTPSSIPSTKRSNSEDSNKEEPSKTDIYNGSQSKMKTSQQQKQHPSVSTNVRSRNDLATFYDDFDKLTLLVADGKVGDGHTEDEDQTVTHFKYFSGIIGHSIKGFKPTMILLPESTEAYSESFGRVLSIVLSKTLSKQQLRECAIICNNIQEYHSVTYALTLKSIDHVTFIPELNGRYPTSVEKEEVVRKLHERKSTVLVTDNRGFRGCEIQCLVSFVDPCNHFTRHELGEVLARATTTVTLLVLPNSNKKSEEKDGTLNDVIDRWIKEDLFQVLQVKLLKTESGNHITSTTDAAPPLTGHPVLQISSDELLTSCKDNVFFSSEFQCESNAAFDKSVRLR